MVSTRKSDAMCNVSRERASSKKPSLRLKSYYKDIIMCAIF